MSSGFLDGVSGTGQTQDTQPKQSSSSLSNSFDAGSQQEDFMEILLAQLQNQNPLEPMSNQKFVSQMSQLTSLQQTTKMNNTLQDFLNNQQSNQYLSLIGSQVRAETNNGNAVEGLVQKVEFLDGDTQLKIDGEKIKTSNLSGVGLLGSGDGDSGDGGGGDGS